jgi:serine/threonine protein kinase
VFVTGWNLPTRKASSTGIKPGNVRLTDDGTTRIGDFDLAMMTDVSRLTMDNMMVSTVSYMPPEQAMGEEVTARADLYSVGAMLYEMVTGRPPFVGDDSVSIIGQHINTPPISPAWHRADLPPAFESLIMLLLEKDPEKRPISAKDVLQALESIEKGDIKEQTRNPTANGKSHLSPFFVGREQELKQLQNAFNPAISEQGSLMMVVGEPGIGKTAIFSYRLLLLKTWIYSKTTLCYQIRGCYNIFLYSIRLVGRYFGLLRKEVTDGKTSEIERRDYQQGKGTGGEIRETVWRLLPVHLYGSG